MLTVRIIERQFRANRMDALLEAIMANGLPDSLPLRVRLSRSSTAAAALGLRRLVELTWGPTSLSREITDQLIANYDETPVKSDPVALATIASALHRVMTDHEAASDEQLVRAFEWTLERLAPFQQDDGLFGADDDHTIEDRAMVTAFILFLLIEIDTFRSSVRLMDAMNWFEQHQHVMEAATEELWHMANVSAPTAATASAAVAAIAA